MNARQPTVVDIFSGAGGLSAGFAAAGYRIIGGVDNWAPACTSLQVNHPEAHVECTDIRKRNADDFASVLPSRPDVLLGGPSCQGFSTAGGFSKNGRDLGDDRNSLFLDYIRFVDALNPEWVVMENVPGLLLFKRASVAKEVIKQFKIIGYDVVPIILLAADFGVPQLRRRVFFIGNRRGSEVPLPLPTHGNPNLWKGFALPFEHLSRIGNKSHATSVAPHITFDEACGDLPPLRAAEAYPEGAYGTRAKTQYQVLMRDRCRKLRHHISFKPSEFELKAMAYLCPGDNWTKLPDELKVGRFGRIRSYDATTLLKRLEPDKPAYTVTTKFNDATTGAFIHPTQDRTLSLREAARLQSFKDSYHFTGTTHDIRKQIGNAVPPLLAEAIARTLFSWVTGTDIPAVVEEHAVVVDPTLPVDSLLGLKGGRPSAARSDRKLEKFLSAT